MLRFVTILAAGAILAACSTQSLEQLQRTEPTGTDFTKALAKEYQKFSEYEAYEMMDWIDSQHFAEKGLKAAAGETVLPEELSEWRLPKDKIDELATARSRLIAALNKGGRRNHPQRAAVAQAKFDCWVEQQEENHQFQHIADCQKEFYAALDDLKEVMEPEPEPEPQPAAMPEPQKFLVFFGFDSSELISLGEQVLASVVDAVEARDSATVNIVGHTDTTGSDAYNRELSVRRATAVRDWLLGNGVSAGATRVDARGESEPMVETGDGVRSAQNRRVEITVK